MKASRKQKQMVVFWLLRTTIGINVLALAIFVLFITIQGIGAINWTFLTDVPRNSMTEGGILPCIIGTVYLSIGSILWPFLWEWPRRFI